MTWRGRLLAVQNKSGRHIIDALVGDDGPSSSGEWVRMIQPHADQIGRTYSYPKEWNLGEDLVCTMQDGSGDPALRYIGSNSALGDGFLITSAYDMGLPARSKRLNHITVHTTINSDADTDVKILVKYRTDDDVHTADDDNWTTAVTANNTPRAVTAELGVEFYLLQVRVDVDDDSGNNRDRYIQAITIDYSAGD
jgi:hypothetical protein